MPSKNMVAGSDTGDKSWIVDVNLSTPTMLVGIIAKKTANNKMDSFFIIEKCRETMTYLKLSWMVEEDRLFL